MRQPAGGEDGHALRPVGEEVAQGAAQRVAAWRSRPDQQEAWRNSKSIQRDLSADLHKIQVPVLQINGRNDRVQHLETALRLMNHLADSRLMIINRCGHWVPFERPDEFSRLVHDFLSH